MSRLLIALPLLTLACSEAAWEAANNRLPTRWSEDASVTNAHPEYPRPMKRRSEWKNLNGLWDYAVVERDAEPGEYDGQILVPYPIELTFFQGRGGVGLAHRYDGPGFEKRELGPDVLPHR